MKRNFTFLSIIALIAIAVLSGFSGTDKHSNGAPAGYTGSPGDGKNCTQCHGGTAASVTGYITSNVPTGGYTPGATYTITVAFSGTGAKGFEVSPQSTSGTMLGSVVSGTGSKVLSNKYVTHTTPINSSSASWSFQWVAPAAGTGAVTFYGAFVISEPNVKKSTMTIQENITSGIDIYSNNKLSLYPNPVKDILNINYQLMAKAQVEINIYGIDGSKVGTIFQNEQNQGNYTQTLDVSNYTKGMYLLEMKQNNQKTVKKIIIN